MSDVAGALGLFAETAVQVRDASLGGRSRRLLRHGSGAPLLPRSSLAGALPYDVDIEHDAPALLVPVRSLQRTTFWMTCPALVAHALDVSQELALVPGQAWASSETALLFVEEIDVDVIAAPPTPLMHALEALLPDDGPRQRLAEQLLVVADADFAHLSRAAAYVIARSRLDDRGRVQASWHDEQAPPESLFVLRGPPILAELDGRDLHVGAQRALGRGWLRATWAPGGAS